MTGHVLIQTLALVVGTAAIVTLVFQRLRLPVVLGYLAAGMLVGPHTSVWFVADAGTVTTLSELGVILLMFTIGLELSVRGVLGVGLGAIAATVIEVGVMLVLGTVVGTGFGLDGRASLFVGAIVAISSTTIISRALDEHPPTPAQRRRVFGLLVVEDLLAILLLTVLTAVSRGAGLGMRELATTLAQLAGFLAATVILGLMLVPRVMRATIAFGRHETMLVAAIGLCFGLAMLADAAGYSVALGAFLAGALVAEADADHAIAPLIEPIRDLFAAIFFVSVGMLIDPTAIAAHWVEVLVVLAVVVGGKIVAVSLGVFVSGRGIPAAITTGMTMAQIGELSFVAASIGVTAGVLPPAWYAVAVAVSAVSTALTPVLVRLGPRAATWVEPRLPRRLATFAALYGSWIESASARPERGPVRRRVTLLGLDAAALLGVVLGYSLARAPAAAALVERFGLDDGVAALLVIAATVAVAAPLLLGMTRLSHALALAVAERALPSRAGLDLGAAPRRMLTVAVQVPILVVAAVPGLAAAGAIAPSLTAAVVAALVAFETWRVWRSAGDLDAHVRAGAQAIVEVLAAATPRRPRAATEPAEAAAPPESPEPNALSAIETVLPGLGTPTAVRVAAGSALVGKTLAATNLRGATGATVLAIQRGPTSIPVPAPTDTILADDVLALAGSSEAIAAAAALLDPPAA
ncbi:MAG: cation:proton antiporter [Myxococcales bacterium]|nr:cation:proton antiporter [Myxococcales bacterium]MBK7193032.1 cation:proton antiporter [Myxococcales bacterium]MBP6843075.1 cation:proton antiporter [Kofleriaceae bacterium]